MFFSSNRSFPFFRVFTIITKTKYLMLFYRRIWKISIGHICGIHAWILLKRKSLEKHAACMKNENHVDQDRNIVALHQCECLIKILRRHVRIHNSSSPQHWLCCFSSSFLFVLFSLKQPVYLTLWVPHAQTKVVNKETQQSSYYSGRYMRKKSESIGENEENTRKINTSIVYRNILNHSSIIQHLTENKNVSGLTHW